MALNPSIILAGQAPDVMGAMGAGLQQAQNQLAFDRQNALADLYKTQGPQIMAGDQNALNALAMQDPAAALNFKGATQEMAWAEEDRTAAKAEGRRMAEEALRANAAQLTADQLAAEQEAITKGLQGAAFFYQNKDQAGYERFLQQNGMDPAQFPFAEFPAHAAMFEGALEAMQSFAPPKPPEPLTQEAKLRADFEAGLIDQGTYQSGLARLAPKGTSLTVDPATGAVTFQEGVGVNANGTGAPKVGDVYNPNEVQNVITMIDEIATNPALDKVVGPLEGGGGNNPDDLGVMARGYYGGDGTALIERIGQLQSNAWLSARAMLKGGGAITDYESRKAEAAVARLSRAKSETEFRKALKDLRDAITDGEAKLRGGAVPAPEATPAPTETKPKRLKFNPETGELE